MKIKQNHKPKLEAGMASMTDLIFLLLIFFIIMSLMANNQTKVDLAPGEETNTPSSDGNQNRVLVHVNRTFEIEGEKPTGEVSIDSLDNYKERIVKIGLDSEEKQLRIIPDKKAVFEDVFKIIMYCQNSKPMIQPVVMYKKE